MYKILIVDDIKANLFTLKSLLQESFKLEIYEALNAKEALEIANQTRIDLIITDVQMPQIDGFTLANLLKSREKTRDIPVIFLTAVFDHEEYKQQGYELGAIDYIIKPIDEALFIAKLTNYLKLFELQKELTKKNEYISELLDASDEGQIILDKYGVIVDFNKKAMEIFPQIKKEEALKDTLYFKISQLQDLLQECQYSPQQSYTFAFEKKFYKVLLKKVRENCLLTLHDVTQEVEEKQKVENILDAQSSIVFLAENNKITLANRAFYERFEVKSTEEFYQKYISFQSIFQISDEQATDMLQNQEKLYEFSMRDKNSEKLYFQAHAKRISQSEFIFVFHDITALQKQNHLLQIESKQKTTSKLISMIAHQWRQPLATINIIISKLLMFKKIGKLDDAKLESSLFDIENMVQYMSRTVDDFRGFFKDENHNSVISVQEIVEKPKNLFNESLKSLNVEFKVEYMIDAQTKLEINHSLLEQVLINLYKNSLDEFEKSSLTHKAITLCVKEEEEYIKLDVCDNAGGIPKEFSENIFEPYFSTKGKNGTGLGLYMSKVILESRLGGTISYTNQNGGTCFSVSIPKSYVVEY